MGKFLVTGGLSRQCNPDKNKRDVMVSWLLAQALRSMGHEVEHRNPGLTEDYAEFDKVFIGMSALHSLGCNRSYGMLAAYLRTYGDNRAVLYLDDVETAKIISGLRVMKNDPGRLCKPFYTYRKEYDVASDPAVHGWLMEGVKLLHDYAWPTTLIPVFPWGDARQAASSIHNITDPVAIDLSPYVPDYTPTDEVERSRRWSTECKPDDKWLKQQRPVFAVDHYCKGELKRPDDKALVHKYAQTWGVLDPGLEHGWFRSRLPYAVQAGALYVTKWQNIQPLGNAFALLPDHAAGMEDDVRENWANAQRDAFNAAVWTNKQVKEVLNNVLEKKAVAA